MTTADDDRYLRLSELARYTSLSVRQLQRFIADRKHPLPTHRFAGRTVLVKRSEFDQWAREREGGVQPPADPADADDELRIAMALRGYPIRR